MPKNLSQQHGASILGCEPTDGVLGVLTSSQINIATFVHQMDKIMKFGKAAQHLIWTMIFFNFISLSSIAIILLELPPTSVFQLIFGHVCFNFLGDKMQKSYFVDLIETENQHFTMAVTYIPNIKCWAAFPLSVGLLT